MNIPARLQRFDDALDHMDLDPALQCALLLDTINLDVPATIDLDAAADKGPAVDGELRHLLHPAAWRHA